MYPTYRKRLYMRLSLLAMICAVFIGALAARALWQQQMEQLSVVKQVESAVNSNSLDWVEIFATVGEGVLQLFVGEKPHGEPPAN